MHFSAVGVGVFRTLPEKRHQTCCDGAWGYNALNHPGFELPRKLDELQEIS